MDAAPLTGSLHSTPAAGACQQAAACKALERGMRESMPAAATCRGAGPSPAKRQDLVQQTTSRAICRRVIQCHHMAHAHLCFQVASCSVKHKLASQEEDQVKPT